MYLNRISNLWTKIEADVLGSSVDIDVDPFTAGLGLKFYF